MTQAFEIWYFCVCMWVGEGGGGGWCRGMDIFSGFVEL